jgi:hypothetical protein
MKIFGAKINARVMAVLANILSLSAILHAQVVRTFNDNGCEHDAVVGRCDFKTAPWEDLGVKVFLLDLALISVLMAKGRSVDAGRGRLLGFICYAN